MNDRTQPETYDVIVVGGGPAGENAAWYARANGLSVALVERELVGGECSYWACMPSKALLRPGEALAAARRVPGAAAAVTGDVDVAATLRSRDAFASHWDDTHQVAWMEGIGATLVRGHGRLVAARTVEVDQPDGPLVLVARRAVVLATGSSAALPPVEGLGDVAVWDSRKVTSADDIPRRLAVLGGGPVGVEMAQAYRHLGAQEVTIVQRSPQLLPREEPIAGERLEQAFEADDIDVRTGTTATRVWRDDTGVSLALDDGTAITADELVVATGRRPNTVDLGLSLVGGADGDPVEVDDQLRVRDVDGGWLYAVGDVNGRSLQTHQGKYQARVAADVIAGRQRAATADHDAVPRVVFTDPQVAAVGLTEAQARDRGHAVTILRHELGAVAGAALLGRDVSGIAQLVVDAERRTVLGATFVGPHAGELLHAATIAIVSGITLDRLWDAVPAFPTVSEVWLRLLEEDRGV